MPVPLTFTFVNPNPPEAVEHVLRRILTEKLTVAGRPCESGGSSTRL